MAKTTAKPAARKTTKTKSQAKSKTAVAAKPRQPGVERRKNHPMRAKNGHISLLLTQAVPDLGKPGELVKVRPGFARNYLVPQGLATFATPHNLQIVEKHRERLRQLEVAKKADLQNLAAQISQRSLTIEANANAEGHLYGSVSAVNIATALRAEGFRVDEEHVQIESPLKELGLYTITLNLGMEVTTEVKLWVVPNHTAESPA